MSDEGDTFWVSFAERIFGLALIVIGALMLYFTATSAEIGWVWRILRRVKRHLSYHRRIPLTR